MPKDLDFDPYESLKSLRESIRKLTRVPRVLVVDDADFFRETLCSTLHGLAECEITEAVDGENAVSQLAQRDFDVIFLDLRLPGMSGIDVMYQLSEEEKRKLIVVTGMGEGAEEIKQAICLGAVKVITKPINIADLKALFSRPI
jgi:CheY-like chemotaxis protein